MTAAYVIAGLVVIGLIVVWYISGANRAQRKLGQLETVEEAAKREDEASKVLDGPLPGSAAAWWDRLRKRRSKS